MSKSTVDLLLFLAHFGYRSAPSGHREAVHHPDHKEHLQNKHCLGYISPCRHIIAAQPFICHSRQNRHHIYCRKESAAASHPEALPSAYKSPCSQKKIAVKANHSSRSYKVCCKSPFPRKCIIGKQKRRRPLQNPCRNPDPAPAVSSPETAESGFPSEHPCATAANAQTDDSGQTRQILPPCRLKKHKK